MNEKSKVVSLRTMEIIENEAADWLARLDGGNLSAEDRAALRSWLSQDPEHGRTLKSYASIWVDMDVLLNDSPNIAKTDSLNVFSQLIHTKAASFALATIVLCAVSVIIWTKNQSVAPETSFHVTSVGIQQVERFNDGSTAHINTDSMIETEFSDSARIVRLLRGEAMFDVTHDPERPFIVYAGNRAVRAIGTKFVVRLTSDNLIVTVTDGQVQLSKRSKDTKNVMVGEEQEVILVSEGEEVEVSDKTAVPKTKEIQNDELDRRLSWLKGQLVFNNERLEQVIQEVSRYIPDKIIIDDPNLRDIRISGRFEVGDTDALLEAIEVSFNVQASHNDDQVIHLSR
jgi:transmembrane sensor